MALLFSYCCRRWIPAFKVALVDAGKESGFLKHGIVFFPTSSDVALRYYCTDVCSAGVKFALRCDQVFGTLIPHNSLVARF
jgi:hypothetical protein